MLHYSWVSLTSPILFCILLPLETIVKFEKKKKTKQTEKCQDLASDFWLRFEQFSFKLKVMLQS